MRDLIAPARAATGAVVWIQASPAFAPYSGTEAPRGRRAITPQRSGTSMNQLLPVAGLLLAASAQAAPAISEPAARFADHPTRCAQFLGGEGQIADSVGADYAQALAEAVAAHPTGARATMDELRAACAARLSEKNDKRTIAERVAS